jgi:hypothetical protein
LPGRFFHSGINAVQQRQQTAFGIHLSRFTVPAEMLCPFVSFQVPLLCPFVSFQVPLNRIRSGSTGIFTQIYDDPKN